MRARVDQSYTIASDCVNVEHVLVRERAQFEVRKVTEALFNYKRIVRYLFMSCEQIVDRHRKCRKGFLMSLALLKIWAMVDSFLIVVGILSVCKESGKRSWPGRGRAAGVLFFCLEKRH